jgi:hypothetical protein
LAAPRPPHTHTHKHKHARTHARTHTHTHARTHQGGRGLAYLKRRLVEMGCPPDRLAALAALRAYAGVPDTSKRTVQL